MKKNLPALLVLLLALAGCATPAPTDYTPTLARFFLEDTGPAAVGTMTLPVSGAQIAVTSKPVFTEGDIVDAVIVQVELGRCLALRLTPAAARDLYRLTASNQGRRLVLTLNGEPLGARRIEAPLAEGMVLIFVEMPEDRLPVLVTNLRRTSEQLQRAIAKKS